MQDRGRYDVIDQAELERLLRAHLLARQHHVESGLNADLPWQTLGAAGAGEQAEL
jgi:hypothetical protein